jgi:hypothetical protein
MANGDIQVDPEFLKPQLTPGATGALANPPAAPDPEAQARAAAWNAQAERMQKLTAREESLFEERQKKLAPMYDEARAASRNLAGTSQRATAELIQSQLNIPPYRPPDLRQDAGNWMMLAAGFGAIAGAFSRYHTTTALNSFAGMLQGFNKGSLEAINQNYETWNANARQAEAYNRQALTRYKAVMDNAQLNWDQKANMIKMTADQYQDAIMSSAAEQKNITQMMEIYDKQDRFAEGMKMRRETLEMHKKYYDDYEKRVRTAVKTRAEVNAIGAALKQDEVAAAAMSRYEAIAVQNGKVMRALIGKVNPTEYTDLNTFLQALKRKGGDQDVNQFIAARTSYNTELGRILNTNLQGAGALSNQARTEASEMLQPGAPPGVVNRVTKFFDQEMEYKKQLVEADRKYQQGRLDAYGTGATAPAYEAPEPPPIIPPGTEGPTVPGEDIEVVE